MQRARSVWSTMAACIWACCSNGPDQHEFVKLSTASVTDSRRGAVPYVGRSPAAIRPAARYVRFPKVRCLLFRSPCRPPPMPFNETLGPPLFLLLVTKKRTDRKQVLHAPLIPCQIELDCRAYIIPCQIVHRSAK